MNRQTQTPSPYLGRLARESVLRRELMSLVERGGEEARLIGSHTIPKGDAYTIGRLARPDQVSPV